MSAGVESYRKPYLDPSVLIGWLVAINLCHFEPGELDPFLPNVRAIPLDEPF